MSVKNETSEYMTQALLKCLFHYDEETGLFTRLITTGPKGLAGSIAGSINDNSYVEISVLYNTYLAHRLAWLYVYGVFPTSFIDHIDTDTLNNAITNLREATNQENGYNSNVRSDSTTKYTGVSLDKRCGKYRAYITHEGKQISLGYHATAKDASIVREAKAKELHGEFYRDNT